MKSALSPRGQRWLIGLLMGLVTLTPMGIDIYLPSLPAMAQDFGRPVTALQASITLFIFAVGVGQVLIGPLADRYGRRPVAVGGVLAYLLGSALGAAAGGRLPSGTAGVVKELEQRQKKRATRIQRDSLDRALLDLAGFYRDVLAVQFGSELPLANEELRPAVQRVANGSAPESTLRRIEAVLACREAIDANVAPLLAVEAMALTLRAS